MRTRLSVRDGLIFDLDGTLWDSTHTVAIAWTNALATEALAPRTFYAADVAALMGRTLREIAAALFPRQPPAHAEALVEACLDEEVATVQRLGGRLYPGVAEGLAALAERYPLFIVSNCQRGYIEAFLDWSGLAQQFRDHECHGNTRRSKAENLRRVVARNGLRAPLFLGDTDGDHQAAQAAGLAFLHAGWGFGHVPATVERLAAFAELAPWLAACEQAGGSAQTGA